MTPERVAANRANARLSRGPTSPDGVERIREAQIVHGCYSKAPREAMRALGENPQDFDRLLASLFEVWEPENAYEAELVRRLARVMWRLGRSDRVYEGMTVYEAELTERHLERENDEDTSRHKNRLAALERLLEAASRIDFYPDDADYHDLYVTYGEKFTSQAQRVYGRMLQLKPPSRVPSPEDKKLPATISKDEERQQARAEIRSMLRQEIEAENVAYRQRRDQRAREASDAYRDACLAPNHPQAALMLRVEDSAFHQMRHLHQILTELKAKRRKESPKPPQDSPDEGKSHDVIENKG